jgi:hypothetical protein
MQKQTTTANAEAQMKKKDNAKKHEPESLSSKSASEPVPN